jgi:predicted amidophosphoribosyltransferase
MIVSNQSNKRLGYNIISVTVLCSDCREPINKQTLFCEKCKIQFTLGGKPV